MKHRVQQHGAAVSDDVDESTLSRAVELPAHIQRLGQAAREREHVQMNHYNARTLEVPSGGGTQSQVRQKGTHTVLRVYHLWLTKETGPD